jgi:hypothetical protein
VRKGSVVEGPTTHAWCAAVAVHVASAWTAWSWAHGVVEAGAAGALEASGAVGEGAGLLLVGQVAVDVLLAFVIRVCVFVCLCVCVLCYCDSMEKPKRRLTKQREHKIQSRGGRPIKPVRGIHIGRHQTRTRTT